MTAYFQGGLLNESESNDILVLMKLCLPFAAVFTQSKNRRVIMRVSLAVWLTLNKNPSGVLEYADSTIISVQRSSNIVAALGGILNAPFQNSSCH